MKYKTFLKIFVIMVVAVIGISCVSAGLFDSGSGDALKGSGQYKVGKDVPAGEYYVKCNGYNLYVEVSSDSSGTIDSIVYNNGYYKEGMYKVGTDIPAGEHQAEANSGQGYIEVSSDSRHQIEGIVSNDNFQGNKYITLEDGQYVTLSNGAQIKA